MLGVSAVSAGGALGATAALLDGDVHGRTAAVIIVAASKIITPDGGFGSWRNIVRTDIAIGFIVAVTAANRIGGAGVVNAYPVQTASTAFVVTAVRLGTVKITHFISPPTAECPKGPGICIFP